MSRHINSSSNHQSRGGPASQSSKKDFVEDPWQTNMHFAAHLDNPEDAKKLAASAKLVGPNDQFVEYIRHIGSKFSLINI